MEETIRIEALPGRSGVVILPADLSDRAGLVPDTMVEFGARRMGARLDRSRSTHPGRIGVAADVLDQLGIPLDLPYSLRVGSRRIRIGPVIGILAAHTAAGLTPDRLRAVGNHLLAYRHTGGLYLAFDLAALDLKRGQVDGYRYCGDPDERWEPGTFPIPPVIFRRFGLPLGEALPRLRVAGVKVFNERSFDKWEAWRWMATDPSLHPHLPETTELRGVPSVVAMLANHDTVFVKPTWGGLGLQILRVTRQSQGFSLDISGAGRTVCADESALVEALSSILPRPGIVQAGLDLATAGNRLMDFRVIVQKDGAGRWCVPGIVARCGAAALFMSNMATGGFPLPVEDGLALLFGDSPRMIFRRKQQLVHLGLQVAEALDRGGLLLGDLGLDIAYDRSDHPWVIEANNRDPDHHIAWESNAWSLFYRFRGLPAEYAAWLSGCRQPGGRRS